MFELETAKENFVELFDIRTHEVDEMIRQRMEERTLYGQDFDLLISSLLPHQFLIYSFK